MRHNELWFFCLVAAAAFYLSLLSEGAELQQADMLPPGVCQTLADALSAKVPTIIIGDVDRAPQYATGLTAHDRAFVSAYWGFGLTKVKVLKIIRSQTKIPSLIYVQKPNLKQVITKGTSANLRDDGRPKLFFLIPGKQLREYTTYYPLPYQQDAEMIREAMKTSSSADVFEKLGIADVLNADNWLEVFDGRGAVGVKTDIPQKPRPPVTPSPPGQFSYWRARQADEQIVPFMLPKEFLGDLEILLDAYAIVEASEETAIAGIRAKLRSFEAREVLDQWVKDAHKTSAPVP